MTYPLTRLLEPATLALSHRETSAWHLTTTSASSQLTTTMSVKAPLLLSSSLLLIISPIKSTSPVILAWSIHAGSPGRTDYCGVAITPLTSVIAGRRLALGPRSVLIYVSLIIPASGTNLIVQIFGSVNAKHIVRPKQSKHVRSKSLYTYTDVDSARSISCLTRSSSLVNSSNLGRSQS